VIAVEGKRCPPLDRLGVHIFRYRGLPEDLRLFCRKLSPCILILDSSAVSALQPDWLLRETRAQRVHAIAYQNSTAPGAENCEKLLRLGCVGVLESTASPAMVRKAVRSVLAGELWASRRITSRMLKQYLGMAPQPLTSRELEVMRCVADGSKNEDIAERLSVSIHTVRSHLRILYDKLGLSSRDCMVRYAAELRDAGQN
jgi:DNA-binding NarL/FixJ family response regulator